MMQQKRQARRRAAVAARALLALALAVSTCVPASAISPAAAWAAGSASVTVSKEAEAISYCDYSTYKVTDVSTGLPVICAVPTLASPVDGETYTKDYDLEEWTSSSSKADMCRLVMYYMSPGSPMFDKQSASTDDTLFSDVVATSEFGKTLGYDDYIVICHIAISAGEGILDGKPRGRAQLAARGLPALPSPAAHGGQASQTQARRGGRKPQAARRIR